MSKIGDRLYFMECSRSCMTPPAVSRSDGAARFYAPSPTCSAPGFQWRLSHGRHAKLRASCVL